MGEVNGEFDIAAELLVDNRSARLVDLRVFADALRTYQEASVNIRAMGAIVMHPRTGAPIENPYLKVQKQAGDVLGKCKRIKSDRVMRALGL